METIEFLEERASQGERDKFLAALDKAPDTPEK